VVELSDNLVQPGSIEAAQPDPGRGGGLQNAVPAPGDPTAKAGVCGAGGGRVEHVAAKICLSKDLKDRRCLDTDAQSTVERPVILLRIVDNTGVEQRRG